MNAVILLTFNYDLNHLFYELKQVTLYITQIIVFIQISKINKSMHLREPQKIQSIISQFYSISQVVYANVRLSNTFTMPEIRRFKHMIFWLNLSIYNIYDVGSYQILKFQIENRKQYQSLTFEQKILVYDSLIELFPQKIKLYEDKISFIENSQRYQQIIKGYTIITKLALMFRLNQNIFQKKWSYMQNQRKQTNIKWSQIWLSLNRRLQSYILKEDWLDFTQKSIYRLKKIFNSGRLQHYFNNQLNNFYLGKIYFIKKQFRLSLSFFQYFIHIQKSLIYKCIIREYLNQDNFDPQKAYQRIFMSSKKSFSAVDKLKLIYKEVRRFEQ